MESPEAARTPGAGICKLRSPIILNVSDQRSEPHRHAPQAQSKTLGPASPGILPRASFFGPENSLSLIQRPSRLSFSVQISRVAVLSFTAAKTAVSGLDRTARPNDPPCAGSTESCFTN